jgi:hypothetical protein
MNKNNKFYVKKPFKQRAINFAHSLVFWKGRKKGMIHTRNIEWEDIRYIFAPKNFHEKYCYLGCVPYDENSKIFRAMLPLVLAMDYEAKPKWCPRWFLRFLDVFGNDRSIVRVRNHKLHNLHRRLTKGIRLNDYKTKWQWYDLRISISAPEYLQNLADDIENRFYDRGEKAEKEAQKLMNKHYIESIKKENEQ